MASITSDLQFSNSNFSPNYNVMRFARIFSTLRFLRVEIVFWRIFFSPIFGASSGSSLIRRVPYACTKWKYCYVFQLSSASFFFARTFSMHSLWYFLNENWCLVSINIPAGYLWHKDTSLKHVFLKLRDSINNI